VAAVTPSDKVSHREEVKTAGRRRKEGEKKKRASTSGPKVRSP